SLGELYLALEEGITKLWDDCYVGDENNKRQKNSFKEYHNTHGRNHGFSQAVNSKESALRAIAAIIEQGEGANEVNVPRDFRPPSLKNAKEFDPGWYKGNLSHYQKFKILFHNPHLIPEV